jgi:hypothetical protein
LVTSKRAGRMRRRDEQPPRQAKVGSPA